MQVQITAESYSLNIQISKPHQRVWQALVSETSAWWPKEFHTSPRAQRFVIEPVLGGRAFEDFGGDNGLVWYSVVGLEVERTLLLAGHLLPPFGGPAITSLQLTLTPGEGSTLLQIRDDRFGSLGRESPLEGWRVVFDSGLRQYLESRG